MVDLNTTIKSRTNNLTKALSNNIKQQCAWSEEIQDSFLEYAKLHKNPQYFVQHQSQNNEELTTSM
ncbi:hypothetical protein BH11BAC3_BH11BAC3_07420 [soil metagenome]